MIKKIIPQNVSVIICGAGMGVRLGIGTTKALIDVAGKPLIIRQLELLDAFTDVRVVVGFDAERLINVVKEYRKDIMFVFNYEYERTGPADSLRKALLGVKEYVIILDSDTILNPIDFNAFTILPEECIVVSSNASGDTIKAEVENNEVKTLSKIKGNMQWSGIAKIESKKLQGNSSHTYKLLENSLPMKAFNMRLKEINTQKDYENAIGWFMNGGQN